MKKQEEVLASTVHLMEIDLLHAGVHTVAAPLDSLHARGSWDYLVALHRASSWEFQAWAVQLRQHLPRVAVPLSEGDSDVVLDLQSIFDRCYDEGAYARRVNYSKDPPEGLKSEDLDWVRSLIEKAAD